MSQRGFWTICMYLTIVTDPHQTAIKCHSHIRGSVSARPIKSLVIPRILLDFARILQ